MNQRITLVVPTLNEAEHLPTLLACLAGAAIIEAIIVSDGGSTDRTLAIARAAGAIVIEGGAGRGAQLSRGIARAPTPWLLLLHADVTLRPGWEGAVRRALDAPGRAYHGRLRFADAGVRGRILEGCVALRCALFRLPYGDQGLMIHRDLLAAIGGMPRLPLMEDVALARALGRRRLAPIDLVVTADASAYRRDGWVRRPLRNVWRLMRFLGGAPAGELAIRYRR